MSIPINSEMNLRVTITQDALDAILLEGYPKYPLETYRWNVDDVLPYKNIQKPYRDILDLQHEHIDATSPEWIKEVIGASAGASILVRESHNSRFFYLEVATVVDHAPIAITQQPLPVTVDNGASPVFTASASGSPTPSIQWQVNIAGGLHGFQDIPNATTESLTVDHVSPDDDGSEVRVVFSNPDETVISDEVTLNVTSHPTMTIQPEDLISKVGDASVFNAVASGHPTPTVQWQENYQGVWEDLTGETTNVLMILTVLNLTGTRYRAVFTSPVGTVTSDEATLLVVG